jgi:ATP-dependent DNA helicase DinG
VVTEDSGVVGLNRQAADPDAWAEALGPGGALSRLLDGFAPREEQHRMAEAVAGAIASRDTLVVEAGTGVGKTLAYLLPALASGVRTVLSTGTRALQDQLYDRDLPLACRALGMEPRLALLKGRSNYLCLHRLGLARASAPKDPLLARISQWSEDSDSGDVSDLRGIAERDPVWPAVTSTTDNCLGQQCPEWESCFLVRARRRALGARVLVINHHLLLADMALREEGVAELLPDAGLCVLDEAHQLPELAGAAFGTALSSRQLHDLVRDCRAECQRVSGAAAPLPPALAAIEKAVLDLRLALGSGNRRGPWGRVAGLTAVERARDELARGLETLAGWLAGGESPTSRGLEHCRLRSQRALETLALVGRDAGSDHVQWFETRGRGLMLRLTPLDVSGDFRARMAHYDSAWVFTSATLAVADSFEHFADRMGLADYRSCRLDSPFDYRNHALLYQPPGMPEPNSPDYTEAVVESALPVLQASGGRAFMLFTSHRALQRARTLLERGCGFSLFVQGEAPKAELLESFRASGNGVLLATASFWEGIDVRGSALSVVVIDRLPFAAPDDPVLAARLDLLRERGENPFHSHQLPAAVIALKQGVGRLIRDATDRGVLVLCDPRLNGRSYGRRFLQSLPPMPRTASAAEVSHFLLSQRSCGETAGD